METKQEKLSDSEKWDGSWDSKKGLEIQLSWKKEAEFKEFRNKIKNWLLDIIMGIGMILYVIMMVVWFFFPLSKSGDSSHGYDLVRTVFDTFMTLSLFTQVIFAITLVWIFLCLIIFVSYEPEKEDS